MRWHRTARTSGPVVSAATNETLHVEVLSLAGLEQLGGRVAVSPHVHLIPQLLVLADAAYSASLSVPAYIAVAE
jgi:hypothetical protein